MPAVTSARSAISGSPRTCSRAPRSRAPRGCARRSRRRRSRLRPRSRSPKSPRRKSPRASNPRSSGSPSRPDRRAGGGEVGGAACAGRARRSHAVDGRGGARPACCRRCGRWSSNDSARRWPRTAGWIGRWWRSGCSATTRHGSGWRPRCGRGWGSGCWSGRLRWTLPRPSAAGGRRGGAVALRVGHGTGLRPHDRGGRRRGGARAPGGPSGATRRSPRAPVASCPRRKRRSERSSWSATTAPAMS